MRSLPVFLVLLCWLPLVQAAEDLTVLPAESNGVPTRKMLYHYLETQAKKHFDVRRAEIAKLQSEADVLQRGRQLREKFIAAIGGLPERMKLKLVEPLRELFKDEVRAIGLELGLPREMIDRHPFPGPGLGVRILGEVTQAAADTLRAADHIFIEELRKSGWYDKTSQAFAVYVPSKSVGVTGDGRRYEPVIALRAVETVDFMTARWARLPHELLDECARRIVNEVPGVSRVVYDITGKPPATIEWE